MSYHCELALIIGGRSRKIKRFVSHLFSLGLQNEEGCLQKFKQIEIAADLSVFAFYSQCLYWDEEAEIFWRCLRQEAEAARLPYIFQRIGESLNDAEMQTGGGRNFDFRLFDLSHIVRHIQLSAELIAGFNP